MMKKSNLCLLTYGFIFLFLGSMVIDSYLLATIGYILAIGSLILTISTFKDFELSLGSDAILFSVQFAVIYAIGNAETSLIIYMLIIYNTLMFEVLQHLSATSAKHVLQRSWIGITIEMLLLITANGIVCNLLQINQNLVYSYLPMMIMLFFPLLAFSIVHLFKKQDTKSATNKNVCVES